MTRPVLFYDGACPLCRREIQHYIKLDQAARIVWIDIHKGQNQLESLGVAPDQALRIIHALGNDGKLHRGIYAFLTIWEQLPYYRHLGRLIRLCRAESPLQNLYYHFARWRYRRRRCRCT